MSLQFAAASAAEQSEIIKFLLGVFPPEPGINSFNPEFWEWKYFSPHPEWEGPRSYVLKNGQEIAAHGGIWPVRISAPARELKAVHLIDWAGSRASLGAGIHLLRTVSKMADIMIAVGGTRDTLMILPKIGYKPGGVLKRYVRVVRPWRQFLTRPEYDWKTPLRFLRNSSSIVHPLPAVPDHWRISKVDRFDASHDAILKSDSGSAVVRSVRSAADLNHILECPAGEFSGYVVSTADRLIAYFLIVRFGRQARIIEMRLNESEAGSDLLGAWRSLCGAAACAAARDPQVCEIVMGASGSKPCEALEQCGFRVCRQNQILYYDPRNLLPPGSSLDLNLVDTEFSYLYNSSQPYLS